LKFSIKQEGIEPLKLLEERSRSNIFVPPQKYAERFPDKWFPEARKRAASLR
jgi:hypothetical protein